MPSLIENINLMANTEKTIREQLKPQLDNFVKHLKDNCGYSFITANDFTLHIVQNRFVSFIFDEGNNGSTSIIFTWEELISANPVGKLELPEHIDVDEEY